MPRGAEQRRSLPGERVFLHVQHGRGAETGRHGGGCLGRLAGPRRVESGATPGGLANSGGRNGACATANKGESQIRGVTSEITVARTSDDDGCDLDRKSAVQGKSVDL